MGLDKEPGNGDLRGRDPMTEKEIQDLFVFLKDGFESGTTDWELAEDMEAYAANKEHLISVIRYLYNKK